MKMYKFNIIYFILFLTVFSCSKKSSSVVGDSSSSTSPTTSSPDSSTPTSSLPASTTTTVNDIFKIGSNLGFYRPLKVIYLTNGESVVLDSLPYYFKKFSSSGNLIGSYVTDIVDGVNSNILNAPKDFDIDLVGNIYLLTNKAIKVYNSNFILQNTYSITVSNANPTSILLDIAHNRLFVSDISSYQIDVYDLTGNYLSSIGSGNGDSSTQISRVYSMQLYNNKLYLLDTNNKKIKSIPLADLSAGFTTEKTLTSTFSPYTFVIDSSGNYSIFNTSGVATFANSMTFGDIPVSNINNTNSIYSKASLDLNNNVILPSNGTVYNFQQGSFFLNFTSWHDNEDINQYIFNPRKMAIDPVNNNICILENVKVGRVSCYSASGTFLWRQDIDSSSVNYNFDISIDNNHNLYLLKRFGLYKYNSTGTVMTEIVSSTDFATSSGSSIDIGVDNKIYIYQVGSNVVEIYDDGGNLLNSFYPNYDLSEAGLSGSYKLRLDSYNNIYVLKHSFINVFSSSGIKLYQIPSTYFSTSANSFDINSQDQLFFHLSDTSNLENKIVQLTTSGTLVTSFTTTMSSQDDDLFFYSYAIGVNSSGEVLVSDTYKNNIIKYTSSGTIVRRP